MDLGSIWDSVMDDLDYLIHFEWLEDTSEFFSGFFSGISEFSIAGLIQGLVTAGLTFYVINKLAFVTQAPVPTRIFYTGLFLLVTFIFGYLSGKKTWDD